MHQTYTNSKNILQTRIVADLRPSQSLAGNWISSDSFIALLKSLLTLLLFTITHICAAQPAQFELAKKGVLDLRRFDLANREIELNGQWKWYWQQMLGPNSQEGDSEFTTFPQLWSQSTWKGQEIPSQGYATYALTILLPPNAAPLMLELPDQYTAYRLFVNGVETAHDGTPGTSEETTVPHWSTQLVRLPANVDTLHLLMQIANFHHAKGGPSKPITLGQASRLQAQLDADRGLDFLLTGSLFMSGLFFLGLFLFSRNDRSILFFGLFCLAYCYRIVGTDQYPLQVLFSGIPWGVGIRLEYLSLYLAIAIFVFYTQMLYPQDTHRPIIKAMAWICLGFVGTVIIFPPLIFSQFMNPFLGLMICYIGYALYVYWQASRYERPGSVYSLMSTGLLLIVFGLIILQYYGWFLPWKVLLFTGYLGFFFLQSVVLSYRFAFALNVARHTEKQFLANMSHEIRTPLNAILGFSNLLEKTPLDTEQKEYVDYIRSSGKNLLTIVNDILDISKIEAGMMPLETIPFSISSLADSIQMMFQTTTLEKNLKLVVEIDPSLPPVVLGDPTRLTQILLNLLSNAVKFTQQGGITMQIVKKEQTGEQVRVYFSVEDTGIGMDADVLPHIFERFRQASNVTTRFYGGTGLGLNIVKSLVEMQGGWINVNSTLGKGSRFELEITYKLAPSNLNQLEDAKITASETGNREVKILIVEDNPINQKLATQVLKRLNYPNQIASNGQIAIEMLQEEKFDLVLMDIQMPVMDGYTATKYIRNKMQSNIPIVAMTAHALASEREQCLQAGMNDFLPKPFQIEELNRIVRKFLPVHLPNPMLDVPQKAIVKPTPTFGVEALLNATDHDVPFAADILQLFLNQTPEEIKLIRQALEANELGQISRIIHSQKVAIQMFGLSRETQLIFTIEKMVAEKKSVQEVGPSISEYADLLEAELPLMATALSKLQDLSDSE